MNVDTIAAELAILQENMGIQEANAIQQVEWENEFVDDQGRRAPRWRRKHGDIAYVRALTAEGLHLTILINTKSAHVITGQQDEVMNYDKVGDDFKCLWKLLAVNSAKFQETFDASQYTAPAVEVPVKPQTGILGQTEDDHGRDVR